LHFFATHGRPLIIFIRSDISPIFDFEVISNKIMHNSQNDTKIPPEADCHTAVWGPAEDVDNAGTNVGEATVVKRKKERKKERKNKKEEEEEEKKEKKKMMMKKKSRALQKWENSSEQNAASYIKA
jgi:hypothetical protein